MPRRRYPRRAANGIWLTFLLLAWIAGCAGAPRPLQEPTPPKPASKPPAAGTPAPVPSKPYTVFGKWYQPLASADGYSETGLASWYGKKFHRRPTSSGEPYNMYGLSAAHKTLPLQTWVRVHNLENDRQMDLRINDRGPFVDGRIIDLSYGAAQQLGVVGPGTAKVSITALGRRSDSGQPGQPPAYTPVDYTHGNFTFQVGAFKEPENANRLRDRLSGAYDNVHIATYFHADYGQLYAVRLGRASTLDEAAAYKAKLRAGPFPGAFTVAE
jgi:rare lipoprotein A